MERRKDRRIKVSGDSFITARHAQKKIGRIIDISRGGLAFHYLNTAFLPDDPSLELGIWFQDQNLFLPDVCVNTISDIQVNYPNPFKQIPLRRRSVQFRDLSLEDTRQLDLACLLHHHLPESHTAQIQPNPLQT